MSKKATVIWCIFIGLLDGLYCIGCEMIPHIQNYMWIGFISLPIFFCGGAALKLIPRYIFCAASGVLWGALTIFILGMGLFPGNLNMLIVVTAVVAVCCTVHMAVCTEDTKLGSLFCNCPMVFGGFAAIFSQGNSEIIYVIITLAMGIVLGWIMEVSNKLAIKLAGDRLHINAD